MPPYAAADGDGASAIPRPDRRASPRLGPSLGARLFHVCFYLGPQYIAARSRRRTACTRPVKLSDLSPLPSCSPLPFCASSVAFLHSPLECLILRLVNGSGSKGATARFKGATIVSRFRSSPEFAARSEANFGIEGH